MKIFIYKSLFVSFLVLILFKLTIGALVNNYEEKFEKLFSKEYINKVKINIKTYHKSNCFLWFFEFIL